MSGFTTGIDARRIAALCLSVSLGAVVGAASAGRAEPPNPVLNTLFPPGGRAGTSVDVAIDGGALDGTATLRFSDPSIVATKGEGSRFTVTIPAQTPPGTYDVRAVGINGASSPRSFVVGSRPEELETEPNDQIGSAAHLPLDVVVNGRIDKPGDVDCFRFSATAGQRIVLECRAERIDSQLRGVIEVNDALGNRLAANRGYTGIDPLVDFIVPVDGEYTVKVFDLTYAGGGAHFYRLEIDTGPRVEFTVPAVIERGKTTRVALFGRNLLARPAIVRQAGGEASGSVGDFLGVSTATNSDLDGAFDRIDVDITPPDPLDRNGLRLRAAQWSVDGFAFRHYPGNTPLMLSVTDVPVVLDSAANHSPGSAQEVAFPCEVSGQLTSGDEQDWYAVRASRGDVLWLEAFGERIDSPVDLDLVVLNASGERELAHFADCLENLGGYRFPTNHLDSAGRWVAPADGRFLIMLRNLTGGLSHDPRRVYRLSIRREEPDFQLAVVSRRADQPAGLNVGRGGRAVLDVLALRRRGMTGPIRVTAENLPGGIECPEIWIGPGVDRAPLIFSAVRECPSLTCNLTLVGHADLGGTEVTRAVCGGTMIWPGQPMPSGRLTGDVCLATGPEAPLLLTAFPSEAAVDQESVLDVAVEIERPIEGPTAAVDLTGVDLPELVANEVATIPAGQNKGWISFHVPASLLPGPYTLALQAETVLPQATPSPGGNQSGMPVALVSNPITIHVAEARIGLEIDPRVPKRIARGQIIQLRFAAQRKHGFIGKIHVEMAAPGVVVGLRSRGVTLVGQSDSGSLQVIANDDAPLGRQPFLRLQAVGTVEDKPVYRAARFVELEITE